MRIHHIEGAPTSEMAIVREVLPEVTELVGETALAGTEPEPTQGQ